MKSSMLRSLLRGTVLALAVTACSADGSLGPDAEVTVATAKPQLAKGGSQTTSTTSWGSYDTSGLDPALKALVDYLVSLLPCEPEPYRQVVQTIGPKGGKLVLGNHTLVVPRGALSADVTITGEVITGWVNSVRLSPEGLTFATPATLQLSYANCSQGVKDKKVAYTDEALNILEVKTSRDDKRSTVSADLGHFSRYAVAW